jgi:hypothetical protein
MNQIEVEVIDSTELANACPRNLVMFLCLLVEFGPAVLLPHAYTVSDEPRSMVNARFAHHGEMAFYHD